MKLWPTAKASLAVFTNILKRFVMFCNVLYFFVNFGGQTDSLADRLTDGPTDRQTYVLKLLAGA